MSGYCAEPPLIPRLEGWPAIYQYIFTDYDPDHIDSLLVEAGGYRVSLQRSIPDRGFRSCWNTRDLTPETRHHLLAEMLKEPDSAMTWPTHKTVWIVEGSREGVQRKIGEAVEQEERTLRQSVQVFQARGLITPQEAETSLPKLSITINYWAGTSEKPLSPTTD